MEGATVKKNILLVGGTSGIGLKLAQHYVAEGHRVCITGRQDPHLEGAVFYPFAITDQATDLIRDIDALVADFSAVNTLIYAAGYLQRGLIDTLSAAALQTMTHVGLLAPMMLVRRLKAGASGPLKVMLITSEAQYTPRALEPAYCATKAGLAMFGASLVRDRAIGKVLVTAPSDTDTPFWAGTDQGTTMMLDAGWVAEQIVELSGGAFKYKYAKILANPARVDVVECFDNDFQPIL